jgi:4-alpha-glucanotransferase
LGVIDQPNIPGTVDEHPNWRRRYPGQAKDLLDGADTRQRLAPLARRDHR